MPNVSDSLVRVHCRFLLFFSRLYGLLMKQNITKHPLDNAFDNNTQRTSKTINSERKRKKKRSCSWMIDCQFVEMAIFLCSIQLNGVHAWIFFLFSWSLCRIAKEFPQKFITRLDCVNWSNGCLTLQAFTVFLWNSTILRTKREKKDKKKEEKNVRFFQATKKSKCKTCVMNEPAFSLMFSRHLKLSMRLRAMAEPTTSFQR